MIQFIQSIERSFLTDPLTTNNAIYRDSLTVTKFMSFMIENRPANLFEILRQPR